MTSAVSSLRAELAIVRLEVAPAAFTVNVDGRDARPADGALTLDPGAHTLLVGAPGHVAERRELRLAPSERYVFQTTLRREPTPHPPATAPPTSAQNHQRDVRGRASACAGGCGVGSRRSVVWNT